MRKIIVLSFLLALLFCTSTAQAKLVGPYKGKLIDGHTGLPVSGASVIVYWIECMPYFEGCHSEPVGAELVYTDKEGAFDIGVKNVPIKLLGHLESSSIAIYQPGFMVYSSEADPFKLMILGRKKTIRLERIPPDFDHKKHYGSVTDSLRGLDSYTYRFMGRKISTKKEVERSKIIFKRREFLRRAYWEYLRGEER